MKWNQRLFFQRGLVLCGVAFLFLSSFLYFGAGKLSRQVALFLAEQVETDLSVGSGNVNIVSSFPWVAVSFRDVHIGGRSGTPFIDHCDLTALLHPVKALFGEVHMTRVRLKGGSVHIEKKNGAFNYQVFKKAAPEDSSSDLLFMVREAQLENIHFTYQDTQNGQDYNLLIQTGKLNGQFSSSLISMETDIRIRSKHIRVLKNSFAQNVPLRISGHIGINLDHRYFTFTDLSIASGKTRLLLAGSIRDWNTHTAYRLDLKMPDGSFDDILHILPGRMTSWTTTCLPAGNVYAEAQIRGRSGAHEHPHISLHLNQTNGKLFFPHAKEEITNVRYQFTFDNGGARTLQSSIVVLDQFEGNYDGDVISGNFEVKHLNFPIGNGRISGQFPVRLFNLEGNDPLFTSGFITLNSLTINDLWIDFISADRILDALKGGAKLDSVTLSYQQKPLCLASGNIWLEHGEISVDSIEFQFARSSGRLSGTIDQLGKSINLNNPDLVMYHLDLDASSVCLDDFISPEQAISANTQEQGLASFVHQKQISLPSGNLTGKIDTFSWGEKRMLNMTVDFASTPHTLFGIAQFNSASGGVHTDFEIHCDQNYHLDARVRIDQVQLSEAFRQWNDFGQDIVTSDQIGGMLDGQVWINATMDRQGMLLPKTLHAVMGIQISDGELNRLGMLEHFSKYIHIKDLQNLRFATLRNYIEVKNGQVFIPAMFIQSNAANLTVNGVHGLDQRILYNIKINAGQVLAKQFKKFNPKLEPLPAVKEGFINLYYTIFGTTRDFKYESNKTGVHSSFRQSEEIRQHVLERLRSEFEHVPDWMEPEEWQDIPEYGVPLTDPGTEIRYLDVIKGMPR